MKTLPPLPPEPAGCWSKTEPYYHGDMQLGLVESEEPAWSADQMHAYARQAQIDTLEAAAKVCEKRCVGDHNREDAEAIACAAAIRSLINP